VFDTSVKNTFNIHITIADGKSCKQWLWALLVDDTQLGV
jgi:hypothetical protein